MLRDRDSKQSIQVVVRVRPVSQRQLTEDPRICVKIQQSHSLQVISGAEIKTFAFDSICYNSTQEQIFEKLGKKCAMDCLEGYNCTVFAYGQTGAGKTYTMMGPTLESENFAQNRGLVPRTMQFLFEYIDKERDNGVNFICRCSFLEIYNEQIIDLLNKSNANMQLREDTRKGVYVQGITEENITRSEEAVEILYRGSKARHTGSTNYNQSSSRSHSVFTLQIQSKYTKNGVVNTKSRQLNFVDLAGSERTKQSTGERLKEGCNINKSLMNLSSVINALSQVSQGKIQHVNYRNSKLTFLLKDSLGGNSKTTLIANISPSNLFYQETISTLGFARRAKLIKREKASINEDSTGNLQSMKNEIKRLKQEVINLMSRFQENNNPASNEEKPAELTLLMHQYLEQEIQKQTKLQIEILRLNDRIMQLQKGMKQYSNNEIHLRMVISIFQDKISRLKHIQEYINANTEKVAQKDQAIMDYLNNERASLLKEATNFREQAEGNKFLKELMKEAKILKEEGQDENIKELLIKNTTFLNTIHQKLNELKPEKIIESEQQFEKKLQQLESAYQERQVELQERLDQANLQLSEFKARSEEQEKLMDQALSEHIVLEEKLQAEQKKYKELDEQHHHSINQIKVLQHNLAFTKAKKEELLTSLHNKQVLIESLKGQIQTQKTLVHKHHISEAVLKAEVESLKKEKEKADKQLLETLEDLQRQQENRLKGIEEIASLKQQIQALTLQCDGLRVELEQSKADNMERQNKCKQRLQEIQNNHDKEVESKVKELHSLISQMKQHEQTIKDLNNQLIYQRQDAERVSNQFKETEAEYENLLKSKEEKIEELQENVDKLKDELQKQQEISRKLSQDNVLLQQQCKQSDLNLKKTEEQLEQMKVKQEKEQHQSRCLTESTNRLNTMTIIEEDIKENQVNDSIKGIRMLLEQEKMKNNELNIQNENLREKQKNFENYPVKLSQQVEELYCYKQKWELQRDQTDKIENELAREKEISSNLKALVQNKSMQTIQLQIELQEKQNVYKKLVEKIAKNEGTNKSPSEHYSKTIELLEKSRSEQIELRRQNQQLRQTKATMKEIIQQKQATIRQLQHKSQDYSLLMKKRMDDLHRQNTELQRNYQKMIKQRKVYEKFTQDNENLKQQIRNLKSNANKIALKNEEMEGKIKRANQDSIKLQREYEQIKRGDLIIPQSSDERTVYINRLKAEVASLKTEKVLLSETLNRERDEKSKLKSAMKYGKQGDASQIAMKLQIQKKIIENKNLTELIFEVVSHLKICVNEPKAKLEMVRSLILGAIRQKNEQVKKLKEKVKSQEGVLLYRPIKVDYTMNRQSLEQRQLNSSLRTVLKDKGQYASQNEKAHLMGSYPRQNSKQFERYYSKFRGSFDDSRGKNV